MPGDGEGQRDLVCCSSRSHRVGHDLTTEQQQQYLYSNTYSECFTQTLSFDPHNNLCNRNSYHAHFYRRDTWDMEKLSRFPKVTELALGNMKSTHRLSEGTPVLWWVLLFFLYLGNHQFPRKRQRKIFKMERPLQLCRTTNKSQIRGEGQRSCTTYPCLYSYL